MSTIVLTGGGTAGHCIPHLAIYPFIKDSFDKFYYIGSENGIERRITKDIFEYIPICTTKLKRQLCFDNFLILRLQMVGKVNEIWSDVVRCD